MKVYCNECKHWGSINATKESERFFAEAEKEADVLKKSDLLSKYSFRKININIFREFCFNEKTGTVKDTPERIVQSRGLIAEVNKDNNCPYFEQYIDEVIR